MKRGSTLFLKMAIILFGIFILVLCIFLVPVIANDAVKFYPSKPYIKYLIFIHLYSTALPFYFALYQGIKLLTYIDKDKAFSELSVKALKNIKNCATVISILYVAGLPLNFLIGDADDAPGIILVGLIMAFLSMVIAVFAGVIQKLFMYAIDIKSENDLTI